MNLPQVWKKRLMHITPNVVILFSAISLSSNMVKSVSSSQGLILTLTFAGFIFASILFRTLSLKYALAAIAFFAFFNALPELSFDRLVSVMYLSLILLAFLLPSPLPIFLAAGYFLYFISSYWPQESMEMIRTIVIGIIVNTILYALLAFYLRNLKQENAVNVELNEQLNQALGKLQHIAYYDTLTKLPNRELLKQRMIEELTEEAPTAVLFLDLDHFKNVNDMLGHSAGDRLLQDVASLLSKTVGQSCFISRYAGDEFVLLMRYQQQKDIEAVVEQLIHAFRTPFQMDQKQIYATLSVGISLYPEDASDADTLIQYADKAMYSVKSGDKNGFRFFYAIKSEELLRQVKLENDLRSAVSKRELAVHYQPLVEMSTGKIRGLEALLRWTHPELGPISPSVFIPLAEQTGVIVELGEWVLNEACRQVRTWQRAGNPDLALAVNISIRQFRSPQFASKVISILENTDFEPTLLELEITESMVQNLNESVMILGELKRQGVKISIDDFGTGYSSLSVLRHLPVDLLKIDRSFTRELTTAIPAASIVKLIIDIGHSMNLQVICEGIENPQQFKMLQQYGCEIGQGYYFYRPSSAEEIEILLHRRTPA
ncbi:putative bifunctional diguanylate cyclase/phosphodiesterase [Paenibacillus aquistagni]|uniref:Diguanylate cyclase (GGDEF) domain-containing protein n=1 Tax=Paenibacillus aquistagni TaxID=1852522 RepID=A0A1X7KKD1_9BACL|nr:EAL domain-containing protein [Paenibacillus aquistagni]SMG41885.1 diguanylate cyclase (GGDEF) domain-containing protein [Paenibacillus aquistagni]